MSCVLCQLPWRPGKFVHPTRPDERICGECATQVESEMRSIVPDPVERKPIKHRPIIERINAAFEEKKNLRISFADLAEKCFPVDQFPRAWRSATGGGPPGCYMALSAALRRARVFEIETMGAGPSNRIVSRRKIAP